MSGPSVFYDGAATWLDACSLAEPLLALCRTQTRSDGAYVYVLDREQNLLRLTAWSGLKPIAVDRFLAELELWPEAGAAIAVATGAWAHARLRNLPEFVQHRYESVFSVPLFGTGAASGFANFCRRDAIPFGSEEAAFALSTARALGELLARTEHVSAPVELQEEVQRLSKKLADRKLIERAKGILQEKFGLTEEDAYFSLRRTSRRRREAMGSIARRVIRDGMLPEGTAVSGS